MNTGPNIIFIMTDQQRADTIHALGSDYMITPGMDRLAQEGFVFRSAYACGATCIASRAALFTGMFNHNTGVYSFNRWAHHRSWVHDLRDAGYHCVNIGKMHIAPRDDPYAFHERVIVENPTSDYLRNGGVDDDWGRHLAMHGAERPNYRQDSDPNWRARHQGVPWHLDEHLHSDVFIGDSALAWIRRHRPSKPVFLQIGFTGPHEPYDPLPRHLALYEGRELPDPVKLEGELDNKPPQHKAHQHFTDLHNHEAQIAMPDATPDEVREMRRHYYAKITTLDEKLCEIMDALEEKGYLENAVVFFTSDHGDMAGDHQMAYKWLMYEGITNIPLIIWDTRRETRGETHDLVSHIDIGPTVLAVAGISPPKYLEGQSLMPYLQGGAITAPDAVFCEDNYLTMVRTPTHKYVSYTFQESDGELYDLTTDPDELTNLFHQEAYLDVRTALEQQLRVWLQRSQYKTAGYRNQQPDSPGLFPQDHPYLHPGYRSVPRIRQELGLDKID